MAAARDHSNLAVGLDQSSGQVADDMMRQKAAMTIKWSPFTVGDKSN
jgi:hypothetical protein